MKIRKTNYKGKEKKMTVKERTCDICHDVAKHYAVIKVRYGADSVHNESKRLCDDHYDDRGNVSNI